MIETAGEAPGGPGSTGAVGLPISRGSCSRTPGGSFLVAAAAASETESSKHVLNSFLIADFLPGFWCRQGCFHFLLGLPSPESSVGCLLLTFNQSLYHLSHLYPPISLSFFFYSTPVSPFNKYSWTRSIFVSVRLPQSDIAWGITECATHRLGAKGPDMYS